jgi:hypothetical protein
MRIELLAGKRDSEWAGAFVVLFVAILLGPNVRAAIPARYRYIDLGNQIPDSIVRAADINNKNCVVAYGAKHDHHRIFVWQPKDNPDHGTVMEIQLPDASHCDPLRINDYGQILLDHQQGPPSLPGWLELWTPETQGGTSGKSVRLPLSDPNAPTGDAFLTQRGDIYGDYLDTKRTSFVSIGWVADQTNGSTFRVIPLSDETGALPQGPAGATEDGWVIAANWVKKTESNLWTADAKDRTKGTLHRVGPIANGSKPVLSGFAAINNRKVIVTRFPNDPPRVFQVNENFETTQTWSVERVKESPGQLEPRAMNDEGVVIGLIHGTHLSSFIWKADAGTHDLATLVDELPVDTILQVEHINNSGWITGIAHVGKFPNSITRACVLIPSVSN